MCKIIVLFENNPSENKSLKTGHGLSFLIDTGTGSVLFDCGPDDSIVYNCHKLGIRLSDINYTVLSHNHYDHAGGYIDAYGAGLHTPLITGMNFFNKKYAFDGIKFTALYSSLTENFLSENEIPHTICGESVFVCPDCTAVGQFEVSGGNETIPGRMVSGLTVPPAADTFADEVCLVIDTEKGLVVLVGCSHPGILSMLKTVSRRFGRQIYAVLGGTHLVEADETRLAYTVSEMKELGIQVFGLNHCSGSRISQVLQENGIHDCVLNTGDVMIF